VEVIGDGVLVGLADRALLRAEYAREVAEVIDRERQIRVRRLTDRLAVVDRLDESERRDGRFELVGDLVERFVRCVGEVRFQLFAAACAASRASSTSSAVDRATSQSVWPVIGVGLSKYWPRTGGTYSPPIQFP
jgi:hypothetical protein